MARGTKRVVWLIVSFIIVSTASKAGLVFLIEDKIIPDNKIAFLSSGFLIDFVILPFFVIFWGALDIVTPEFSEGSIQAKWEQRTALILASISLNIFVLIAVVEFEIWIKLGHLSDFNVFDYFEYIQNFLMKVRAHYPVELWLIAVFGLCAILARATFPRAINCPNQTRPNIGSKNYTSERIPALK